MYIQAKESCRENKHKEEAIIPLQQESEFNYVRGEGTIACKQ